MNNLKYIREIYGITQDEIAKVLNVNRVTISSWEKQDERKTSNSNLEKLSLFYGIGLEYFYDKPVDKVIQKMLVDNSRRQREIEKQSNGMLTKVDDYNELFSTITFDAAIQSYMNSMKLLLATADEGSLTALRTALKINEKMGNRLKQYIEIREDEILRKEESLLDLIESLTIKD